MESRMNLLNEKEKSLTLYEQKLKEVELKNNQLLTNIESVCSVLEAKKFTFWFYKLLFFELFTFVEIY